MHKWDAPVARSRTPPSSSQVLHHSAQSSAWLSGHQGPCALAVWTQVRLVCLQGHILGLAGLLYHTLRMAAPAVPGLSPKLFLIVFCRGLSLPVVAAASKYQRIADTDSLAVPFSYAYTSLWIWSKEV